jgi:hypothetical protein
MSEGQSLSSIVPLAVIEQPACPKCQAQMMLAPASCQHLAGTALHTFDCAACNHALKTLAACEDSKLSEGLDAAVKPFSANPSTLPEHTTPVCSSLKVRGLHADAVPIDHSGATGCEKVDLARAAMTPDPISPRRRSIHAIRSGKPP